MGVTVEQLGQIMSAQEFGLHYVLEANEPLTPAEQITLASHRAAQANGPLQAPEACRIWATADFLPDPWARHLQPDGPPIDVPPIDAPPTVQQILAQAIGAGMKA